MQTYGGRYCAKAEKIFYFDHVVDVATLADDDDDDDDAVDDADDVG